jgi:hypothetical protein
MCEICIEEVAVTFVRFTDTDNFIRKSDSRYYLKMTFKQRIILGYFNQMKFADILHSIRDSEQNFTSASAVSLGIACFEGKIYVNEKNCKNFRKENRV